MDKGHSTRQQVEYKFLKQSIHHDIPRLRYTFPVILSVFQLSFIALYGFFVKYDKETTDINGDEIKRNYSMLLGIFHVSFILTICVFANYDSSPNAIKQISSKYPMFMNVHSMIFIGFGFLMTFLKRYGFSSIGFNFLIGAFVIEWAILVRGWFGIFGQGGNGTFSINISNLLVADFCAAAVLISFGAVIGKASLSQLITMATFEVVIQSLNEFVCVHYLKAYDVGGSMYIHVFGAYFGLAVSKIIQRNDIESNKESSHYNSDLLAMVGTIFLWLYWPSFNSAMAIEEGQTRAVINTYLALAASCTTTYLVSLLVGRGRLNMIHIQNATLAGGVAVGAVADMMIQPFGAMLIGSIAGAISTLGFHFITPYLNQAFVHDTRGIHNLHGLPGIISGIASAVVAALANKELYGDNDLSLYKLYPSRSPASQPTSDITTSSNNDVTGENSTQSTTSFPKFHHNLTTVGVDRSAITQGGFQMAALCVTILIAVMGGFLTGIIMRLPFVEKIDNVDEMFDDEPNWQTPEDFSLKLTQVNIQNQNGEEVELTEKELNITDV